MEAGRELDALVAEKVMGADHRDVAIVGYGPTPSYSTDIAAAWQVWEKLGEMVSEYGDAGAVAIQNCCRPAHQWCVIAVDDRGIFEGQADTAPLAICLAALQTVGVPADGAAD